MSYVCTLRSPAMVLGNSTGGVAGRVLLHQHALVWHNASTPKKTRPGARAVPGTAAALASSISIPFARIGSVAVAREKTQQVRLALSSVSSALRSPLAVSLQILRDRLPAALVLDIQHVRFG